MENCNLYFDADKKTMRRNIKIKRGNKAVSDVVGTILLLIIAVSIFSVLYFVVLSPVFMPDSHSAPVSVDIIGTIEGNNIILEHRGGDAISLDSTLLVNIGGLKQKSTVKDYLNNESKEDGNWNMGERLVYPAGDITGLQVEVTVIDEGCNYVIISGSLQKGEIMIDGDYVFIGFGLGVLLFVLICRYEARYRASKPKS